MINPIKRVFVPKPADKPPVPSALQKAAPPATKPISLFDELPQPDMEEKDTDSIWAEFDSVRPLPPKHK